MKRLVVIVILFTLMTGSVFGSVFENDGSDWLQLTQNQKLTYVAGIMSGLSVAIEILAYMEAPSEVIMEFTIQSYTIGDVVDMVDSYYSDRSRRGVPIRLVILLIMDHERGL